MQETLMGKRCIKHNQKIEAILHVSNTNLNQKIICNECIKENNYSNNQIFQLNQVIQSLDQMNLFAIKYKSFKNNINSVRQQYNQAMEQLKVLIDLQLNEFQISIQNSQDIINDQILNETLEKLMNDTNQTRQNELQEIKISLQTQEKSLNQINNEIESLCNQFSQINLNSPQNTQIQNLNSLLNEKLFTSYQLSSGISQYSAIIDYDINEISKKKSFLKDYSIDPIILNLKEQQLFKFYPQQIITKQINQNIEYTLYIKACSNPNPGKSGIGIVLIQDNQEIALISQNVGNMTNNQAEFTALLYGLKFSYELGIKLLKCFSNNDLLIKQQNNKIHLKCDHLIILSKAINEYVKLFTKITFTYFRKHQNIKAENLASKAINEN